jgi:hypothetical protein
MLQSNQVLSFFRPSAHGDWSQRELEEFYRVEDALTKSGVGISTDRGLTDEGEPWFVFFRQDNEEVIAHFARIGGEYVVASNFTETVARGRNFQTLVRELLDSHPYVLPKQPSSRSTVFLHPATLLAALVVTGYFKSSELNASADDGSPQEKAFGWFLNRHDLAATYSAIVIASVWDSLAIDSSVSKPSDDLASLDHALPAHGEHGPDIEQAIAGDSLLQNIQAFHSTDGQSVLTAAALNLDGQDAVHDVSERAIAGLVANPSGLHPESPHQDNAAASSAHDLFRAENDLVSKLADFRPQQGDGLPIAASEHVERTVTHNPVSSAAPSSPTPDHPASQPVSAAPATAVAHSDTTITPENPSSASHVDDTAHPSVLNVTNLSDAIQAPVSALQPELTSTVKLAAAVDQITPTVEPAAPVDQVTSTVEPAAQVNPVTSTVEPAAPVDQVTSTVEPAAQVNQITSTVEPATPVDQVTSTVEPAAQVEQVKSTVEPAAQVNCAAPGVVTANPLEMSGPMQAFDHQAQHDLEAGMSDSSTLSIVGIDVHHSATAMA